MDSCRHDGNHAQQNQLTFSTPSKRFAASREFSAQGAALFTVWQNVPRRPTCDVDFMGLGFSSNYADSGTAAAQLAEIFRLQCEMEVSGYGLHFESGSVQVASIRDEQRYGGQRIRLESHLAQARIQTDQC